MGYKVNFLDNTLVTAEYLNATAEDLGGGALSFADDMTYGVDALNGIAEALITKGVSRGCSLSVSMGSVTIAAGVLFMPDGRKVVIDSEGVTLTFVAGSVNYVWFYQDALTGFVAPRCTTEEPSGEYVLLGKVSAAGTIEGRPERAVMKNPYLGLHGTESFTKSFLWDGATEEKLLWEFELQDIGYRMLTVYFPGIVITNTDHTICPCCGFVNLADNTAFGIMMRKYSSDEYEYDEHSGAPYASQNGELLICADAVDYRVNTTFHKVYLRFEVGTDNVLRVYQRAVRTGIGSQTTGWYGTKSPVTMELTITLS